MKKNIFIFLFFCFFVSPSVLFAQEVWREDFDSYTRDYICSDAVGTCDRPSQYSYFYGDRSTSAAPDAAITTDAERSDPGGLNKRGFRLYIDSGSSGTCCENKITRLNLPIGQDFYLRWSQRFSTNDWSSYAKIFRICVGSTNAQRLILDWYNRPSWGETRLVLFSAIDNFSSYNANPNFSLEDDYIANTWITIEVFVDQTNDEWSMWVDGDFKGKVSFPNNNYDITGIEIGGNQVGQRYDETIDYDDIVISHGAIGPFPPTPRARIK